MNAIGYSLRELERISEVFIKAFKKYSLFYKPIIEPLSQKKKVDERLKEESVIHNGVQVESKNLLSFVDH